MYPSIYSRLSLNLKIKEARLRSFIAYRDCPIVVLNHTVNRYFFNKNEKEDRRYPCKFTFNLSKLFYYALCQAFCLQNVYYVNWSNLLILYSKVEKEKCEAGLSVFLKNSTQWRLWPWQISNPDQLIRSPAHYTFFLIQIFFDKNVETTIYENFTNLLRTYPRLRVGKRRYFAHLF